MFVEFFDILKAKGLKVTLSEWLTLQEALDKGLCNSSLTEFYYVARMILVKSETEYDKFDLAFEECFKGITSDNEITANMLRWLDKSDMNELFHEEERHQMNQSEDLQIDKDDVEEKFKQRLKDQDSEHNGGSYWIGTMGKTSFGNTGGNIGGIRVGGTTGYQSAFQVIGARKYRDFRDDKIIDNRQFQLALRRLRQFSTKLDIPKTELDIDGTIDKTCNNGGCLQIVMEKPRKNSVKLLLLMDSGGTMIPYTKLLNELFQSVHKSNHYKDVKTYYFHNCIYSKLYRTPECENGDWIDTEWMFRNLDSDYKVIIVGDAAMAPEELYSDTGNYRGPNGGLSGMDWLLLMKKNYKKIVWMNPKMAYGHAPWREAETAIKNLLPMYKLTVDGLNQAMTCLMVNK
ncbi:VWA containing CoxE family protein [Kineothrix sp. MB12-C1]|uniref:VWA containing CoxE family protein n=1 Tax=Kineothrix sp. MB12-C1 TaxID=3070215 RepID=UPI0027D30EBE|nr:VWA containing CoxE family protein [Kineothrix sp. MB12-C1]WMC92678.1 VWA containing CoxE family protein [Kineothrix sp. MB12-C1]